MAYGDQLLDSNGNPKMPDQLLGEDKYSTATDTGYQTAKTDVLSGIDYNYKPMAEGINTQLTNRGFGGEIFSASLQSRAYQPLLDSKLNAATQAISKLGLDYQNLNLQKRNDIRQNVSLLDSLANSRENRATAADDRNGKVICTALYFHGLLSKEYMMYDNQYLINHATAKEHTEYLRWGIHIAKLANKHVWFAKLIRPIVIAWSGYMKAVVLNTKPTFMGLIIHKLGTAFGSIYSKITVPNTQKAGN